MVGRTLECLEMRRVRSHAPGLFLCREEDEVPPLAGREPNVVVGEQPGKQPSSGHQLPLEIEDWRVVDALARLAEEPDPERRLRLHQSAQLRHDQPMGLSSARPRPAGETRATPGSERGSDSRKGRKIIVGTSRVCELAPQNRLAQRKTDTGSHGDRLENLHTHQIARSETDAVSWDQRICFQVAEGDKRPGDAEGASRSQGHERLAQVGS